MRLFFDTEFTGLRKDTTFISLGIVAENGKKFYAEFIDYNFNQCDEWIKENVLKNLFLESLNYVNDPSIIDKWKSEGYYVAPMPYAPEYGLMQFSWSKSDKNTKFVKGTSAYISIELAQWLKQFDSVQFVSDVCHYDFVLLIDLFGTAFDLPENVCAACHEINQDIARHYGISERKAFDKSREGIVSELCGHEIDGRKHNSLYDAEVIKAIYEEIR